MLSKLKWIRSLFLVMSMSCLCLQAPLSAECDECMACDGCGDAYRHSRVCQVAAGWVIGGILVAGLAIAIFGGDCHCHHGHNRHHKTRHGKCRSHSASHHSGSSHCGCR